MTLAKVITKFFAESENPVLFAGAGVSVHAGLPTWKAYLTTLAGVASAFDFGTKFQMDKKIAEGKLALAASYYFLCDDIPEARRLKELVVPLEDYDATKLVDLASLPFAFMVTTNFDEAILDAYAAARGKASRTVNIDDPTLAHAPWEKKFYIARIHGRVELPDSIHLAKEHFEALDSYEPYKTFLTHVLTRCSVMFVGFSFLDPAILSVMRAVKDTYKNLHGQQHLALLQRDTSSEFVKELAAHDIQQVIYSSDAGHQELWCAISDALVDVNGKARTSIVATPFEVTKRYLATAYARMKIGATKSSPLLHVMAEGMVSGIINDAHAVGISEMELTERVFRELPVSREKAQAVVSQSVTALLSEKLCKGIKVDGEMKYVSAEPVDDSYERAIERLVSGAINRLVIQEKSRDSIEARQLLRRFFVELLLSRGWDLGAAFAARKMPENIDVKEIIASVAHGADFKAAQIDGLRRSVEDLLTRPDDVEAALLAELGRLSFGLELLIQSPKGIEFFERTLPHRIYLDTNVLMPAITTGHPQKVALETTIATLQKYLKGSNANVSICVFDGFLNEIVSHRRIAIAEMSQRNGEGAMWAEREVSLLGSEHVNVYVGAYFNLRYSEPDLSFGDFLGRYAPYSNEEDLRVFLEELGYKVVRENFSHKRDSGTILHALEVFYATRLEYQRKSAKVIAHDAAQLALLSHDIYANEGTLFVSADRGLRAALDQGGFSWLGNAIITHLGLIQLVDLLCGKSDNSRSIASLYWMCSVSSNTERIRNHLIGLALRQYDAAMAMELKNIVDEISEDASAELGRENLQLESENREFPADRARVNSILGRYEAEFFEKMRREVERREAQLK